MPKPSFTSKEQVDHLSQKWGVSRDQASGILRDMLEMYRDALARKERVYLDDFGTLHVQVKERTQKVLPGHTTKSIIPARLNVKFEESADLTTYLIPAFSDELRQADWE